MLNVLPKRILQGIEILAILYHIIMNCRPRLRERPPRRPAFYARVANTECISNVPTNASGSAIHIITLLFAIEPKGLSH